MSDSEREVVSTAEVQREEAERDSLGFALLHIDHWAGGIDPAEATPHQRQMLADKAAIESGKIDLETSKRLGRYAEAEREYQDSPLTP